MRLEKVDYVQGRFRGADIVMGLVLVDFPATTDAGERVVAGVEPTDTDLGLYVPVAGDGPRIAIGDAGSGSPALISHVAEVAEVGSEEVLLDSDITEIILTADRVKTEEMAAEALTEPIAGFRLDDPVFPLVAVYGPEIHLPCKVEGPFGGETDLNTEIGIESHIGQKICFQGDILAYGDNRRHQGTRSQRKAGEKISENASHKWLINTYLTRIEQTKRPIRDSIVSVVCRKRTRAIDSPVNSGLSELVGRIGVA